MKKVFLALIICPLLAAIVIALMPVFEEKIFDRPSVLLKVKTICQHPDYPTGCEITSLWMLLHYYGTETDIETLADQLPKGALPHEEGGATFAGNPEREFIGDPCKNDSYGVFNGPIAALANEYRPGAAAKYGVNLTQIKELLDEGNPVIAWNTTDEETYRVEYGDEWLDEKVMEKSLYDPDTSMPW